MKYSGVTEVLGENSKVFRGSSEVSGGNSEVLGSNSEVLGENSEVLGAGFYLEIFLWGGKLGTSTKELFSYVTNIQLLSIKHHKRWTVQIKLCMTFTVKFYDVLLLCSDSNVLPSRESDPSMQMRFVLSGVSSPVRSLVLMSFMLLKLRSTVAVVTGRTTKIIAILTG